jgi:peptidoglycan hydrolase CwlO-like protein
MTSTQNFAILVQRMKNKSLYIFTSFFIATFLIIGTVFAQSSEEELKKELERTEQEIREQEAILNQQKVKSNVILGEVNKLTTQIKSVQKNIDAKNSVIKEIGSDIDIKDQTVNQLNDKLDRSTEVLGELVRAKNKIDDISIFEIITAHENISDFYVNVDSVAKIQKTIDDLLDQIRELRGLTEDEKIKLEEKKNREQEIKAKIEVEKKQVSVKEAEQKGLLAASKSVEQVHEQELAAKRAKASAIRSALFKLRDTQGISFDDALSYANAASKATGVRPAFILAILKQESDFGTNVGTCNRPGDPEEKKWYNIMPGPTSGSWRDDQTVYLEIMKGLGRDPEGTPLSCPIGNGWGGAMGPTQFIPTTWKAYASRVAAAAGVKVADPWNPQHAFIATSVYVGDLGASAQTYAAEFEAAGRYYAGGNWQTAGKGYATSVLNHAATFQANIDFLKTVD